MIGFVQAGGASTRFGSDKALVRLDGKTMLARTTEIVAAVCDSVQIVAPAGKYPNPPAVVCADRYPGDGPLGGILTALSVISASFAGNPWALIVSCDMPFLTGDFLSHLRRRAENSTAQVVVPESSNGLEPLCAAWHVHALSQVQAAFDAGIRKVTEVIKRLPVEVLDQSAWTGFDIEGRLFWNMNTQEDFEQVRQILQRKRQP